jgi:hypothetical protein
MMTMRAATRINGLRRAARAAPVLLALLLAAGAGGCATGHPRPIDAPTLAEAETFPYYKLYWVGRSFNHYPLAAVDSQNSYNSSVGQSVYYGDCVHGKGIFGGGSCRLPLRVTTVIYRLHSNAPLGAQRNILIRRVPATVYDEGRSIELYSGRLAIDVFSDTFAHALQAATELRPLNAPGSASGALPPPIYCPGLSGTTDGALTGAMERLPGHPCQQAAAAAALAKSLSG